MEAIRSKYFLWETYLNGMYKTLSEIDNYDLYFNNAIKMLTDQKMFYETGIDLINNWTISCDNFLTNNHVNRIAFIGQASCCYKFSCPEIVTKSAWRTMDFISKDLANKTAQLIIKNYEKKRKQVYSKMDEIWLQ